MDSEITVTLSDYVLPVLKEAAEEKKLSIQKFVSVILSEWALNKLILDIQGKGAKK